ncbi:MAG TPA: hypothetical protein VF809_00770 [Candidatus Saccharimonadales bacterium]
MSERKRSDNPNRYNPIPIICCVGLSALGLLVMNATGGNHNGASKTNVDTMPSYPVAPVATASKSSVPVPSRSAKTTAFVCGGSVFIDRARGEVIVRPTTTGSNSGRPQHLGSIAADGADFYGPLPRANFSVFGTDGREDADQQLNGCKSTMLRVVSLRGGDRGYELVRDESVVSDGAQEMSGLMGAICAGYVHYAQENMTPGQIGAFEEALDRPHCVAPGF